jgi:hypothetical protein
MTSFTIPPDYNRIKLVTSFHELITTPFGNGINALCWQRTLPGDFTEIVRHLPPMREGEGTIPLEESLLASLTVSPAGRTAIDILLEDQRQLRARGLSPILDCIHGYPRDDDSGPVPTDVYSFHIDSATVETDTWLCTSHGLPSEGLRNDQAVRRIDIPETRAELLKIHGGGDDADFLEYLQENCYDLHYAPAPHAQPFSFGVGNLWRIAVQYPGSPVPPFIHRAPETLPSPPPRLLLIS